ncbi:hypothetical protein WMY93_033804, partial [Mugilogobius chulae]
ASNSTPLFIPPPQIPLNCTNQSSGGPVQYPTAARQAYFPPTLMKSPFGREKRAFDADYKSQAELPQ